MNEPTVFVVDDDAAVRDSIQELADSVGLRAESHASAQAFLEGFDPDRPGCLVVDVRMAEMSGLALQEKLNELGASLPVIFITGHGDVPMAVHALRAGAVDFLQKPYRNQQLLDSINDALATDSANRRSLAATADFDQHLATLTPREREVLDGLFAGSSSKRIAAELGISPRTVEAHRQHVLGKLHVGSVKELLLQRISWDADK